MEQFTDIAVLTGIVVGMARLMKDVVPARFMPLFTLALGVAFSGSVFGWGTEGILQGLVIALTSNGLWSGVKAVRGL